MIRLVSLDLPILKRSENTDEAVELFHLHGMYDKEKLFYYRRALPGSTFTALKISKIILRIYGEKYGLYRHFDLHFMMTGLSCSLPSRKNPKELGLH